VRKNVVPWFVGRDPFYKVCGLVDRLTVLSAGLDPFL
jgi:hypothetical protein